MNNLMVKNMQGIMEISKRECLVGKKAPYFRMSSTKNIETLSEEVSLDDYEGKWLVLFFYPLDFTFVCPTEIISLSRHYDEVKALGADVLGVSTDSAFSHRAWIQMSRDNGGLGDISYPLAADKTQQVSNNYGVLHKAEGRSMRSLFIIDPEGIVRYQLVNDDKVGFNVDEVLRVLNALQTDGLCPANWRVGAPTL